MNTSTDISDFMTRIADLMEDIDLILGADEEENLLTKDETFTLNSILDGWNIAMHYLHTKQGWELTDDD